MSDFDNCMKELKSKLQGVEVNVENFMVIVRFSMEVVEVTQLKGSAQKELAVRLVRTIVVEAPISDSKEKLLLDMIDQGVLGNTVDLVVDASRGKLDVNTVVKVASGCCASFLKK
tara:strand:- start:452 stop:796 length:345 start_codon:yes stop_codon:yes gene_type:complete